MVVGPDRERIARLEARAGVSPASVGDALPEAVSHANGARPDALAIALEPALTSSLRAVARREPELFGEILAPTLGAAVRRAVADAMAAMMQRFDEALERSLSLESIRWRIEARRTGRPFAEVVLLRTLAYRVEQIFLIHSETGLLLQHVARDHPRGAPPDQVASMLSAIDSFSREAFGALAPGDHLRQFKVGELSVWVERDPLVTIAAVVRGNAPEAFAQALDGTRARVHLAHRAQLAAFDHDVAPFAPTRATLEPLLREERRPPSRRAHVWVASAGVVAVIALAAVALVRDASRAEEARRRAAYVDALEAEPGIVVSSIAPRGERYRLTGLRDPLAARPEELIARRGLAPAALRFEPFYSLDPRVIERRARRVLAPPRGVTLSLDRGALRARGSAPRAWIERARLIAPALPGVRRYSDDGLHAEEAAPLRAAAASLEAIAIPFARGSTLIDAEAERALERAGRRADRFLALASEAGAPACVIMTGSADRTGTARRNAEISRGRARAVAAALHAEGVPPERTRTRGVRGRGGGAMDRRVTFRADLRACGEA